MNDNDEQSHSLTNDARKRTTINLTRANRRFIDAICSRRSFDEAANCSRSRVVNEIIAEYASRAGNGPVAA